MKAKFISESIFKGPSKERIDKIRNKIINSVKQNNDFSVIKSGKKDNIIILDFSYTFEDDDTGFDFFNNLTVTIDLDDFEYYMSMNITSEELPGFSFKSQQGGDYINIILTDDYEINFKELKAQVYEYIHDKFVMPSDFDKKLVSYLENKEK